MNDCIRLGNAYDDDKFTGGNFGGNVWDTYGLAPAMKTGASASQQCTVEIKHLTSEKGGTSCLRAEQSRAEQSRAEQSRAEQHSLCSSSNEGRIDSLPIGWSSRLDIPNITDSQRKSPGGWTDKSNTDNGEYP